jgi:hypothetical protein
MVKKYEGAGAAVGGGFTAGDPGSGIPASPFTAAHANLLTNELENLVVGAGLVPNYADATQVLQAVQKLQQGVPGLKNLLVNGSFDVWQRGSTFPIFATPLFTADRWRVRADAPGGPGQGIATMVNLFPGDATLPRGSRRALSYAQAVTATGGPPTISQRVPHIDRFSGRAMCFSFYGFALAPTNVTLKLTSNYGVGGAAAELVSSKVVTLAPGWAQFHIAATVPSAFGKTANPPNSDYLEVLLELPQTSGYTLGLSHAQLEAGLAPTTWESREGWLERLLCYQFYEQSWPETVAPGTPMQFGAKRFYSGSGVSRQNIEDRFRVPKRTFPTVTWFDPVTGAAGSIRDVTQNATRVVSGQFDVSPERTGWVETSVGSEGNWSAHWTADAEL